MAVLDVGCGSGAITAGIADAVGPSGRVVGIDISESLLAQAASSYGGRANLSFRLADVGELDRSEAFDVVTSARMLQWLASPLAALERMAAALKSGGRIVVLDYNHAKARWQPDPPPAFTDFYDAFLAWRREAGMDNEIADHLAEMLAQAGLEDVQVSDEHELTTRGDGDFERRMALWPGVIATRGHQIVADGMISEADRMAAGDAFAQWLTAKAQSQSLYLICAAGTRR
jgi:SAM-dependent methyltransferase